MRRPALVLLTLIALAGACATGEERAAILQAPAAAAPAEGPERWESDIRAFEAADQVSPPPRQGILFVGSSSIRLWRSLGADFPGLPVINRGFGGSRIPDVTHFAPRVVLPYRPRLVVFYAGTNDIASGAAPARVLADFKRFADAVHAALPETRIAFISAAPNPARWHLRAAMRSLNEGAKAYAGTHPLIDFIDVWPHMLGPDGRPRPDIFVEDRLHMNERGYAIWKTVVGTYLEDGRP
jgi:lysophospholipase L1-like esterase